MPDICSCITARITVQTVCRCHFLSIIKAITDLRPETTASAPHFGTMSSGRCCADDVGQSHRFFIQMEMSSLLVLDEMIARSAIFLSAFPYNVTRGPKNRPVCYFE